MEPAPAMGMNIDTKPNGAQLFVAFEVALEVIRSLRGVVALVRRHNGKLADQIVDAASSSAANLAEGNRRVGRDRLHFFRIAARSADETRAHLRVALAWGWVTDPDIEKPLQLLDRELGLIWGLTH
jgi:four helix bundle protein